MSEERGNILTHVDDFAQECNISIVSVMETP